MAYKICVQAGHQNIKNNIDSGLRGGSGALSNEYVAGFLDGEGWFRIKKAKNKDRIAPSYQIQVGASSTDPNILKLLVEKYGGAITIRLRKNNPKWKTEYSYSIMCKQAETLIIQIAPFLIIKKERALKCLELSKTKKQEHGTRLSKEVLNYREQMFMEMKELNQRGVVIA